MSTLIPHLKFIEALVMTRKPIKEIQDILDSNSITTSLPVIQTVYKTLQSEQPDYFNNPRASADPAYVEEILQISEMFSHYTGHQLPTAKHSPLKAMKLLNDPTMYLLVTSLAIAQIEDTDIELVIGESFNIDYEFEDIKLFLKYFFNLDGWTLKDRQSFVETITEPKKLKFYKFALKGDKEYLMWKLGVTPRLNFEDKLQDLFTDSYYNFKEKSRSKPDEAQKWAALTIKLSEKLESIQKERKNANKSIFDNFEIIIKSHREDTSAEEILNIKDLNPDD